jgi:hypothetical protein
MLAWEPRSGPVRGAVHRVPVTYMPAVPRNTARSCAHRASECQRESAQSHAWAHVDTLPRVTAQAEAYSGQRASLSSKGVDTCPAGGRGGRAGLCAHPPLPASWQHRIVQDVPDADPEEHAADGDCDAVQQTPRLEGRAVVQVRRQRASLHSRMGSHAGEGGGRRCPSPVRATGRRGGMYQAIGDYSVESGPHKHPGTCSSALLGERVGTLIFHGFA